MTVGAPSRLVQGSSCAAYLRNSSGHRAVRGLGSDGVLTLPLLAFAPQSGVSIIRESLGIPRAQ